VRMIATLIAGTVLVGCASTPEPTVSATPPEPFRIVETEAPDPSPLAGFEIPSGRCGMILWTESGGRVSPIFRSLDVTQATMNVEGEIVSLALQQQTGELRLGMRSNQTYASTGESHKGLTLDVRADWGEQFPGGLYVQGGSLTINGTEGWSRIVPIAGIAGCKA